MTLDGPTPLVDDAREALILDAVDAVEARLAAGSTRDASLEAVPADLRDEVSATLRVLGRVSRLGEGPSEGFGHRLEASFLEAVDRARREQSPGPASRSWFRSTFLRAAAALGAVVLALAGSGFAATYAADDSIPGDTLYPVKEAGEAVQLFLARGDAVTRLRLAQLAKRQQELEAALRRQAPPRAVVALEMRVVATTQQLVAVSKRAQNGGNPAPALASLEAMSRLQTRIDVLRASETRPDVARTLTRMSAYLAGKERELEVLAPAAPAVPIPSGTPRGGTTATPTPRS
ncbi:MAG: hypothetical protein U0360_03555 [Dehalococcoidia bacterium]